MTYIIGIIVIGLFFLALNYFTELTLSQKWNITITILSVLAIIIMFNEYTKQESETLRQNVIKFNKGETITCNNIDINSSNYTLSIGTYTFIGNENTPYAGEMISAADCN